MLRSTKTRIENVMWWANLVAFIALGLQLLFRIDMNPEVQGAVLVLINWIVGIITGHPADPGKS